MARAATDWTPTSPPAFRQTCLFATMRTHRLRKSGSPKETGILYTWLSLGWRGLSSPPNTLMVEPTALAQTEERSSGSCSVNFVHVAVSDIAGDCLEKPAFVWLLYQP